MRSSSFLSRVGNQFLSPLIGLITRTAAIYTASLICTIVLSCINNAAFYIFLDSVSVALVHTGTDILTMAQMPSIIVNIV